MPITFPVSLLSSCASVTRLQLWKKARLFTFTSTPLIHPAVFALSSHRALTKNLVFPNLICSNSVPLPSASCFYWSRSSEGGASFCHGRGKSRYVIENFLAHISLFSTFEAKLKHTFIAPVSPSPIAHWLSVWGPSVQSALRPPSALLPHHSFHTEQWSRTIQDHIYFNLK